MSIPPRGSFSDNTFLWKGSSPNRHPTNYSTPGALSLWKTPWHHMPPINMMMMMMIRLKENHHQRKKRSVTVASLWKTTDAAVPRERQANSDRDFALVCAAYEKATGNRWNKSDSEAYNENGIERVPVDKVISALEASSGELLPRSTALTTS